MITGTLIRLLGPADTFTHFSRLICVPLGGSLIAKEIDRVGATEVALYCFTGGFVPWVISPECPLMVYGITIYGRQ